MQEVGVAWTSSPCSLLNVGHRLLTTVAHGHEAHVATTRIRPSKRCRPRYFFFRIEDAVVATLVAVPFERVEGSKARRYSPPPFWPPSAFDLFGKGGGFMNSRG